MIGLLKPRPLSIWLSEVEVCVITVGILVLVDYLLLRRIARSLDALIRMHR